MDCNCLGERLSGICEEHLRAIRGQKLFPPHESIGSQGSNTAVVLSTSLISWWMEECILQGVSTSGLSRLSRMQRCMILTSQTGSSSVACSSEKSISPFRNTITLGVFHSQKGKSAWDRRWNEPTETVFTVPEDDGRRRWNQSNHATSVKWIRASIRTSSLKVPRWVRRELLLVTVSQQLGLPHDWV